MSILSANKVFCSRYKIIIFLACSKTPSVSYFVNPIVIYESSYSDGTTNTLIPIAENQRSSVRDNPIPINYFIGGAVALAILLVIAMVIARYYRLRRKTFASKESFDGKSGVMNPLYVNNEAHQNPLYEASSKIFTNLRNIND